MVTSQLMLVVVLVVLPRHRWDSSVEFTPDEFTLEKVCNKLNVIFGNKNKSEILSLASGKAVNHAKAAPPKPKVSARGTRKAVDEPTPDLHYNLGAIKYHYCAGHHNTVNIVGPHEMADCPTRAKDRAAGVFRRNIWSKPSRQRVRRILNRHPK
ncbi:unnamed protein product [Phytophthora fragariaefolia]|uniref:Unnamed protein product n=1 Tax=Phytophthora fragariaefolia TaxID=1490495 RepID=A0A9W6Y279_9STRA|nr:unnamed protein product [Phytophthora fragariaefolia]